MKRKKPPAVCPVCGEDVSPNALACRECGADHNSGWKDDACSSDGLDLPDEEFDYNDFVKREFGGESRPSAIKPLWWITGIVLLIVTMAGLTRCGG